MSPERLSQRWLSLRCWLVLTVLPAALTLLAVLALLKLIGPDERTLDHTAVMVGFAALYFTIFRGGHMLMIRSLHRDMMRHHEDAYREALAQLSQGELRRANLGFTLARIKRDILVKSRGED
jgi:predicted lysophospholipase L1 biosynthesis ABC-type transport system permease subunit